MDHVTSCSRILPPWFPPQRWTVTWNCEPSQPVPCSLFKFCYLSGCCLFTFFFYHSNDEKLRQLRCAVYRFPLKAITKHCRGKVWLNAAPARTVIQLWFSVQGELGTEDRLRHRCVSLSSPAWFCLSRRGLSRLCGLFPSRLQRAPDRIVCSLLGWAWSWSCEQCLRKTSAVIKDHGSLMKV